MQTRLRKPSPMLLYAMTGLIGVFALGYQVFRLGSRRPVPAVQSSGPVRFPPAPPIPTFHVPRVLSAETLFGGMSDSVQTVSAENFHLQMDLSDLFPQRRGRAAGAVQIERHAGQWREGTARPTWPPTASHRVDAGGLAVNGRSIAGEMKLTAISPATTRPNEGGTIRLDLRITRTDDHEGPPSTGPAWELEDTRFWVIHPKSQGVQWRVAGSYGGELDGAAVSGAVSGTLRLPWRAGFWNMGEFDAGLKLQFDLGVKRENWNHARLAVYTLPSERDLRAYSGLRVTLKTDRPRTDATVSVWIREQDGSWYYLKSAVPLAREENQAVLLFDDFAEAEWMAPGSHLDEDYSLDLSGISALAIGVINPFGIGKVTFTVKSIELINCEVAPATTRPARVDVTGKMLEVNGHAMVPPGLFGGYAPDLPQQYRPGCQRYLFASSQPRIPRQLHARFNAADIMDWRGVLRRLRGEEPSYKLAGAHLMSVLDERTRSAIERMKPDVPLQPGREGVDPASLKAREVADALNVLLPRSRTYDANAMKDLALPPPLLQEAGRRESLNPTEAVEFNRRLLEAVFASLVRTRTSVPTEAFYVDCFGERKEAAPLLYNAQWARQMESVCRSFADAARKSNYVAHFEFWNEPYLNWAERSRVNYDLKYFNVEQAVEGGPVRVRYANGEDGPVVPHLQWVRQADAWRVVDTTAYSYWSGKGNGWIYDQMFAVAGKAIKETNPAVQVVAGWGFRWHEDHWAPWETLYKPTIDRNIQWIDGIHEHHYQGDTVAMNGAYEVLVGYALTAHRKWLYCYNTETNDLVDAPARGALDTPQKVAAATEYRRMVYNVRDILYCIQQSPDKIRSRTVIHCNSTPEATRIGYGMMSNLRGRMLHARSDDDRVWCVGSVDGTDPEAMPPDGRMAYVVFVFNDHRRPREVELSLRVPDGLVASAGAIEQYTVDKSNYAIGLQRQDLLPPPPGRELPMRLSLPERTAVKISFPVAGQFEGDAALVRKRQFFSDTILQAVVPAKPVSFTVQLDAKFHRQSTRGWLRMVVQDVSAGEGSVAVNGRRMPLPSAITADNVNRIIELPLDLSGLTATTTVEVRTEGGEFDGFRVEMASIVLESELSRR